MAPPAFRALLAAVLALGAALAGCMGASDPPGGTPSPATGGWALDCTLGANEPGPWAQKCLARASHTEGAKQEVWVAVNPADPRNVVVGAKDLDPESSQDCVWNGVFVTHDGGKTWKDTVIGGKYADRKPGEPWFGYQCNTDPMLAFAKDGTLHYLVELYHFGKTLGTNPVTGREELDPGWRLLLATSHDGGDTWPEVITLLDADGVTAFNDYSRMAVSPATGTVLAAINTGNGGLFSVFGSVYNGCNAVAARGGKADKPYQFLNVDPRESPTCMSVGAAPDGAFVVGFSDGFGSLGRTRWAVSRDDGKTFTDPAPGFTYDPIPGKFDESGYRTGTNFEAAFDLTDGPRRGTLYAMYADDSAGSADVYVRSSPDLGATWGDPVRVDDDAGDHHQFMPNLAVAGDGSVHAFFLDKRWDPDNKLVDVTHAWSLDGGATWTNERVTTASWDGDLGRHQEGFPFIGDYLGVSTAGDEVWGAFPDASDGKVTVIAAARVSRTA